MHVPLVAAGILEARSGTAQVYDEPTPVAIDVNVLPAKLYFRSCTKELDARGRKMARLPPMSTLVALKIGVVFRGSVSRLMVALQVIVE